jgi:hypothetical protein
LVFNVFNEKIVVFYKHNIKILQMAINNMKTQIFFAVILVASVYCKMPKQAASDCLAEVIGLVGLDCGSLAEDDNCGDGSRWGADVEACCPLSCQYANNAEISDDDVACLAHKGW